MVNAGGNGVYRLRYEEDLLDAILAGFDRLEPLERFRLVADTWACALAGSTPLEQFFALVRRLEGEKDPSVWTMVAGALGLLDFAVAEPDRPALESFTQSLFGPELERVGWDRHGDDDGEAATASCSSHRSTRHDRRRSFGTGRESRPLRRARPGRVAGRGHRIGHPPCRSDHRRTHGVRRAPRSFPLPVRPDRGAALPRLAQLCPRSGSRRGDLRTVPDRDQEPGCSLSPPGAPDQPRPSVRKSGSSSPGTGTRSSSVIRPTRSHGCSRSRVSASWTRTARRGSRAKSRRSVLRIPSAVSKGRSTRASNAWR